jgi:hypothetical protein
MGLKQDQNYVAKPPLVLILKRDSRKIVRRCDIALRYKGDINYFN